MQTFSLQKLGRLKVAQGGVPAAEVRSVEHRGEAGRVRQGGGIDHGRGKLLGRLVLQHATHRRVIRAEGVRGSLSKQVIEKYNLGSVVRLVDNCTDMPAAYMLADVVAVIGTMDVVFGEIDR